MTCEGQGVADHQRCWARHQTISDPAHLAAAARLRADRRAVASCTVETDTKVQVRALGDYDRLFGLAGEGVT